MIKNSVPDLMQRELVRRIGRNPRYSLRAFARSIGVSHAALSLIMSGKRDPSKRILIRFADSMGYNPKQKQDLLESFKKDHKESPVTLTDLDSFNLMSDWYHFALLSLLELDDAKFDSRWIAARLSISPLKAKTLMNRLQRLGMIAEIDGKMRQSAEPIRFANKVSTAATRKYHKDILARALHSLEHDPMPVRDFSAVTFAMDEALVPYAIEKIRSFRRKLMADLERKSKANRVYNLTVQIYPVSK